MNTITSLFTSSSSSTTATMTIVTPQDRSSDKAGAFPTPKRSVSTASAFSQTPTTPGAAPAPSRTQSKRPTGDGRTASSSTGGGAAAAAEGDPAQALERKLGSLAGHPGNLTEKEEQALERFRAKVTEAGLYRSAQANEQGSGPSHSDATLLRFLRARKFDSDRAFKQFSDAEKWRKKFDVDNLYRTFPVDEMEDAKKFYPGWTGRRDKSGLPVYVYRLANLDSKLQKELSSVPEARRYQRVVSLYEYMLQGVLNLCAGLAKDVHASPSDDEITRRRQSTMRAPDQICSSTTLIDLSDVSLMQLFGVRSHLQQASTLANANYPETLNSIFVVNSPAFFPTVWGWIKGWFDQGTREKINVLGNPAKDPATLATLARFVDVKDIPKRYGGELDWAPGEPPKLDEEASAWMSDVLGVREFRGPVFVDVDAKEKREKGAKSVPAAPATAHDADSGVDLGAESKASA